MSSSTAFTNNEPSIWFRFNLSDPNWILSLFQAKYYFVGSFGTRTSSSGNLTQKRHQFRQKSCKADFGRKCSGQRPDEEETSDLGFWYRKEVRTEKPLNLISGSDPVLFFRNCLRVVVEGGWEITLYYYTLPQVLLDKVENFRYFIMERTQITHSTVSIHRYLPTKTTFERKFFGPSNCRNEVIKVPS